MKRTRHSIGVIAFTAAVVAALVPGFAIAAEAPDPDTLRKWARESLAQIDGEIRVPGLREPVEVLRDSWGVPHLYAENQHDLFFAQGFVAAQDRLFQIDWWRRVSIGETAEVLGENGLMRDRFARLMQYRGDPDVEWTSYAPDAREITTAFTDGINAWIAHIGDNLPVEFRVLEFRPGKWKPEDCLGRMSVLPVAFNLRNEIVRAELVASVGIDRARRVMPADPDIVFAPAPGFDLEGIDADVLAGYEAVVKGAAFQPPEGSNNWVIDGTLSASGKPMLANDPHRQIGHPSLRYLVHLNAPGWNVIGSGEPALPGVALGHNDRIAWGFTVVLTDQADLYVEETDPEDPDRYRAGDGWDKMKILREKVKVRGATEPVEIELRYTRHGPVIHADPERRRASALRWMGSEPGTAAYLNSLAIDRAATWDEFIDAVGGWKAPSENIVYADVDGNIGWIAAALTPVRSGWHGLLPVPGESGAYRWERFLELNELPQALNPQNHFIATANHNILPEGYAHEISYDWAPPFRYERVRQGLAGKTGLTVADFEALQHDRVSIPASRLVRILKDVRGFDDALTPQVRVLTEWDGTMDKDSRAALLYALWLPELQKAFFAPHVPEVLIEKVREGSGIMVLLRALENPDQEWFGDDPVTAKDQMIRETFAAAVAKAREKLGDDSRDWALGKLQSVTFRHPLSGYGEGYANVLDAGLFPSGGDRHVPDQAWFDENFNRVFGATYRQIFDLADWDWGVATSAPGQSGQPGSPHYADLAPLWAEGRYFPLVFSRAKVEEMTRHRLMLRPGR